LEGISTRQTVDGTRTPRLKRPAGNTERRSEEKEEQRVIKRGTHKGKLAVKKRSSGLRVKKTESKNLRGNFAKQPIQGGDGGVRTWGRFLLSTLNKEQIKT